MRVRVIGQQERLARAPGEIAARQQFLEPPLRGRIDRLRFPAQLAVFENSERQAIHFQGRQATGPDLELHSSVPSSELGGGGRLLYLSRRARRSGSLVLIRSGRAPGFVLRALVPPV
jgi:hypothetical protein